MVNIGTQSLHETGVIIFSLDLKWLCLYFVFTAGAAYNSLLLHNSRGRYMETIVCYTTVEVGTWKNPVVAIFVYK